MTLPCIVIDTNVFISALRSRHDASFKLLSLVGEERLLPAVSVALVLEYEAVAKRQRNVLGLANDEIDAVIDFICARSVSSKIHYLWRPQLRDPNDDMLLELAVAAACRFVITFNVRDFKGADRFGIEAITPREFLARIGVKP